MTSAVNGNLEEVSDMTCFSALRSTMKSSRHDRYSELSFPLEDSLFRVCVWCAKCTLKVPRDACMNAFIIYPTNEAAIERPVNGRIQKLLSQKSHTKKAEPCAPLA
jgi:hypothetical protein